MIKILTRVIDFFYLKPFHFIPLNTFRYAAVGGANQALNVLIYWLSFHFLLTKDDTDIFGIVVISAPIMSFLIAFIPTFFTGFFLTRLVAFSGSEIRGREQLFRYAQIVALNIVLNYLGLKLLVDVLDLYPTPSYIAVQILIVCFSYTMQRIYTFRGHTKL